MFGSTKKSSPRTTIVPPALKNVDLNLTIRINTKKITINQ